MESNLKYNHNWSRIDTQIWQCTSCGMKCATETEHHMPVQNFDGPSCRTTIKGEDTPPVPLPPERYDEAEFWKQAALTSLGARLSTHENSLSKTAIWMADKLTSEYKKRYK